MWQNESETSSCFSTIIRSYYQTKPLNLTMLEKERHSVGILSLNFTEVTCEGVWPLPLSIPQHPFVSWVSPQPLSILKPAKVQLFQKKKKKHKMKN